MVHRNTIKRRKHRKHKKTRKYNHKKNKRKKRKSRKRKNQKGGVRKCISGGPENITILTKENKKIILIGEAHLVKPEVENATTQQLRSLIEKSIAEGCEHFSALILRLIQMNNDRNFDLFLEINPEHAKGDFETLGSGGMKAMTRLLKTGNKQGNTVLRPPLQLPNLRVHWSDLRSILKEAEAANYRMTKEDLKKIYGISENNLYWKIITMLKLGGFAFQRMDFLAYKMKKPSNNANRRRRDKESLNNTWKSITGKIEGKKMWLDVDVLKSFTQKLIQNSSELKNDFNEIMLYLFYNSGIDKIQKQWQQQRAESKGSDPQDISRIFLDSTWKNYIRRYLLSRYEILMQKIINDEIRPEDFQEIWKYMKIINTIIFAVVLDYYILGRIMKDYIHDNIIIFTGSAHTRNYIDILTKYFGYSVIYSIESSGGYNDILEYDDTELFMHF